VVVAEVDGVPITRRELDERAAERLARIRQEEYDVRREALDEMIGERLLEKEARARGITPSDLLKDEVDRQVGPPAAADVDAVFEANRARLDGRTKEQVRPQIEKMLRDRALAERREEFSRQLRDKASVKVALEPPRSNVAVPTDAPALGPGAAPVTIVEFSDYQCPYCHRAQVTIDEVMKRYEGRIKLVHRDFPLDGHGRAVVAARASRCAGEQGRFWDYHRSLMTVRGDLSEADLAARADAFKLDPRTFATCLASDRHDAAIRASVDEGSRMGVTGTPTYFINGRMLTGARPFEEFRRVIDAELGPKS
jgi:protein-disulfide isomerase